MAIEANFGDDLNATERKRSEVVSAIPASYNPWLHLGATTSVAAAVLIAGTLRIHDLHIWQLVTVPAMLLFSNAAEWRIHRDALHKRVRPLEILYDRHTPLHHRFYTYDDMAIRSTRELRLVLIPAIGVALAVVAVAPFAVAGGLLLGANVGWLILMSSAFYIVAYEWTHLSYHMPPEHFVSRMWIVRVLREHHRRHHDPRLMQKWNFNVTIPLWDWVRGTTAPDSVVGDATSGVRSRPRADA